MTVPPLPSALMSEGSRCHAHPEQPALGSCTRCGVFFCDQDHRGVDGKPYCDTCAVRPDVDYLESFRLKYWGKRDGWAWLVGLGTVGNLIRGTLLLLSGSSVGLPLALVDLGLGGVGACYWLGMRWARLAYVIMFVAGGLGVAAMAAAAAVEGASSASALDALPMLALMVLGVLIMLMALVIYNDTRNKLFFKVEVPRTKLKKAWHLYMNNRMARMGLALGMLGLILPFVGPFALVCAVIGLRRVDPNAHPPIGRKGQAIAGLVLGTVECLFWGGLLAYNTLLR